MKAVKDIYILIGPPGAGKGSLSQLCKKQLGWSHLSTGDLCRQHITRMTEIGKKIDQAIKAGKLIDDTLMVSMVASWIQAAGFESSGIILDGFPRTVAQAGALDALFADNDFRHVSVTVVAMKIGDDRVINRLKTRFVCQRDECQAVYSGAALLDEKKSICTECGGQLIQRIDDQDDVIFERLKMYHYYAEDLLNYYRSSACKIIDLDVEVPLDLVFKKFVDATGARV